MYKSLVFGDEFLAQGLHLKMITITIIIHLITEDQVLMFNFTLSTLISYSMLAKCCSCNYSECFLNICNAYKKKNSVLFRHTLSK